MTETLKIRMYNVRFGDAVLVTVPDRDPATGKTTTRRILIDVGNVAKTGRADDGGDDSVFEEVVADILNELGGQPLDLYVMTHEHLDHVQGLFYAATKCPGLDLEHRFKVDHVWLTASAHPGYYDTHAEAKKRKLEFDSMYMRLATFLQAAPAAAAHGLTEILALNDPTKTRPCVDFLRQLNPGKSAYVSRGKDLTGTHPFREAQLSIWAPEEDTSEYYGRLQPLDRGLVPLSSAAASSGGMSAIPLPVPPAGVDVGAFLRLIEARRGGIADNMLAIDQAANNTSIVFALEWRGWRLLFAGDAEIRSWKTMSRKGVLKPVHFLKVAHHGSHNGTPADEIFDAILPATAPDARVRRAATSNWTDTYSGIPHEPTKKRLKERVQELYTTLDERDSTSKDFEFEG